ncbi:MAG TPA: calcium/sodium antiporter [Afifellaceae bacterium]|nr:calcium/sodium antiporter [Afifellaceae bacterium]
MLSALQLLIGLVVLTIGADILVRGSVGIAQHLRIPHLIVGLTIVAFGTSAPELVISLKAATEGSGGIAIGNVVGSNIANILIVLGLPSVITATLCDAKGTGRNLLFLLAITLIFLALCWDGELSRSDGVILLVLFVIFFGGQFASIVSARRETPTEIEEIDGVPTSVAVACLFTLIGLIALPFAADAVVEGAIGIATIFGISETAIGVTVVALGTSLPELAAAVMAAMRGHSAVAIGNAIGSNIFNLLAIMGITATLIPVDVPPDFFDFELWAMVAAVFFIVPFVAMCWPIGRATGALMTLAYLAVMYAALGGNVI